MPRHSATVFPVLPCRLATSAIVNSLDNTASTTRIRFSTGNCECPRRLDEPASSEESDASRGDDGSVRNPANSPNQQSVGEYFRLVGPRGNAEQLADDVQGRSRGDVRSALAWGAG